MGTETQTQVTGPSTRTVTPAPPSPGEEAFLASQLQKAQFQLKALQRASGNIGDLPSKLLPSVPQVPRGRTQGQRNPRFEELTQMLMEIDARPPPRLQLAAAPSFAPRSPPAPVAAPVAPPRLNLVRDENDEEEFVLMDPDEPSTFAGPSPDFI